MGRISNTAFLIGKFNVRMMVFFVSNPGNSIHKSSRLEVVFKNEGFCDFFPSRFPARNTGQDFFDCSRAQGLGQAFAGNAFPFCQIGASEGWCHNLIMTKEVDLTKKKKEAPEFYPGPQRFFFFIRF